MSELGAYRATVWDAVKTLWVGFGDEPEAVITKMFPQAAPFVDEMFHGQQVPEATALQIVTNVVAGYIEHGMPVEQRRAALVELHQLMNMQFEQADGYPAMPFVAHVVAAWQVAHRWASAGKVESATPFLDSIVASLATGAARPGP